MRITKQTSDELWFKYDELTAYIADETEPEDMRLFVKKNLPTCDPFDCSLNDATIIEWLHFFIFERH